MIKNYKQSCTTDSITDVLVTPEILQDQGAVLLHVLRKIVNGFSSSIEEPFNQKGTSNHQSGTLESTSMTFFSKASFPSK